MSTATGDDAATAAAVDRVEPVSVLDESAEGPQDPEPTTRRRPATKDRPIAFRPRHGLRHQLEQRAAGRPLSSVVEEAVAAYVARRPPPQAPRVDPHFRAEVTDLLVRVGDALQDMHVQEAGVGRNVNQLARFTNTYRELPVTMTDELRKINRAHDDVVMMLTAIRQEMELVLDAWVEGSH